MSKHINYLGNQSGRRYVFHGICSLLQSIWRVVVPWVFICDKCCTYFHLIHIDANTSEWSQCVAFKWCCASIWCHRNLAIFKLCTQFSSLKTSQGRRLPANTCVNWRSSLCSKTISPTTCILCNSYSQTTVWMDLWFGTTQCCNSIQSESWFTDEPKLQVRCNNVCEKQTLYLAHAFTTATTSSWDLNWPSSINKVHLESWEQQHTPTTQLFQKKINAEHKKQQQQMMWKRWRWWWLTGDTQQHLELTAWCDKCSMAFHDSLDHQDLTPLALPAQIKKYKILYCNKIQSFSIEMHKQTNKHGVPSAVCFMRKKRMMMMSYALDQLQSVSLCFSAQEEHSVGMRQHTYITCSFQLLHKSLRKKIFNHNRLYTAIPITQRLCRIGTTKNPLNTAIPISSSLCKTFNNCLYTASHHIPITRIQNPSGDCFLEESQPQEECWKINLFSFLRCVSHWCTPYCAS